MRLRTLASIGLAAAFGLGAAQTPPSEPAKPAASVVLPDAPWQPDVRLVYESDTRAYYRPCGCNMNSAGGLSRRSALLADMRAQAAPVVVCTAGDFYGTADVFNEPKSRFVARMMGELGYDAMGIGEMDLNFGLATLVADVRAFKLPVVCANLRTASDSLQVRGSGPASAAADRLGSAFLPYRVVTKGGARFGFVGLLSPATIVKAEAKDASDSKDTPALPYQIGNVVEAAKAVIPELRASCDVLIVLAHMGEDEAVALVGAVPGIDFVVLGHDPQSRPLGEPRKVDSAVVLRATAQGQNIGELNLKLGADHHVAEWFNRIHIMDASYRDDPAVLKRIEAFDEENRKLQKELFARQELRGDAKSPFGGHYLGVGACQSCHVKEFEVYTHTRHAHAYATLAAQFVHRDTNCVGCHVTGYGEPGGFEGVRQRGTAVDLIDVQCEACHGPGRDHARDGSYRAGAIKSCVKCHTANDDPDFNFATDWPKIAH